ncbi:MAG: 3'-5' exonuclease [Planctomycetes bacterium]|nr:3'-5' exonuclease [Planctomycetota bacterium]
MRRVAVLDFETTGLRAGPDRIIEVAAAIVSDGEVVATFSELMDPGFAIPRFITDFTGISDAMVRGKPSPEAVMPRLQAFLGDHACVAHNASFDQRFYVAEMTQAAQPNDRAFVCSMLLARRLVRQAPNHQLGTLVRRLGLAIPPGMRAHRALADVLMTCELWKHLLGLLRNRLTGRDLDLSLLQGIAKKPKAAIDAYLAILAGDGGDRRLEDRAPQRA